MDFSQRIIEVGKGKKPSKKVAALLGDYENKMQAIAKLNIRVKEAESPEQVQEANDELSEALSEIQALEEQLEKAIKGWESGIARMENLHRKVKEKEKAAPKKQQQRQPRRVEPEVFVDEVEPKWEKTARPMAAVRQMAATEAVGQQNPVQQPRVEYVHAEEVKNIPKKSNWKWWVLGGVGLLLTLGAVNVLREK